jgi:hypothetical protein
MTSTALASSDALTLCERIGAVGVVISALEWLWLHRQLGGVRTFSWALSCTRSAHIMTMPGRLLFDAIFEYPAVLLTLHVPRLVGGLLLAFGIQSGVPRTVAIVSVAVTSLAVRLRTPYGHDGADQMLRARSRTTRARGSTRGPKHDLWAG